MFLVELIASSFFDLISKQPRLVGRCKRVLVFFFLKNTLEFAFAPLKKMSTKKKRFQLSPQASTSLKFSTLS